MNRAFHTRGPGGTKIAAKRKAELSPTKKTDLPTKKRSAFGDITNNVNQKPPQPTQEDKDKKFPAPDECPKLNARRLSLRSSSGSNGKKSALPVPIPNDTTATAVTASSPSLPPASVVIAENEIPTTDITIKEDSLLYETAIETPEPSLVENVAALNLKNEQVTLEVVSRLPEGVLDFDAECGNDPFQVGLYAQDIFEYYKQREHKFPIKKYMEKQRELNKNMRAILVDWMVEVQENFELNHETLYLAVKLVDMFLGKVEVSRDRLQLLGTTAIYVASKFDERSPPAVDDFCYICDDTYPVRDVLLMEIKLLKTVNFDIGVPLSYRFLRRFARCMKLDMEVLTFARFILESSLMDYELIDVRDSMLASACLFLALTLKGVKNAWNSNLEYYTGYTLSDIFDLTYRVFNMIANVPPHLKTISSKYSHRVFHEVAKIPIPEALNL